MKLVTGTLQEMTDLEHQIFVFGAPFSALLCADVYIEADETVYCYMNGVLNTDNGTTSWQNVFPMPAIPDVLPDGGFGILHIDDPKFKFSLTTLQEYYNMLPEVPEGELDEDYLSPTEQSVKNRIEAIDESLWTLTPQEYVSQHIIGDKYIIIDM